MADASYPIGPHPQDTRTYLQDLIDSDEYGLSVGTIDAYADKLAAEFPQRDPLHRSAAHLAMAAFMDGWNDGYDQGHHDGCESTYQSALQMLAKARALVPLPDDLAVAAFDWLASRLRRELPT